MKKIFFTITLLTLCISCKKEDPQTQTVTQETEAIQNAGTNESGFKPEALSQKLMAVNGENITFEEALNIYKGKPILIDVWASWCPDCIKGMPKVHKLQQEYELVYMFLSYDKTERDWRLGIDKYKTIGENFLIQSDWKTGEFRKTIDLDWIPRYILVDKTGKIAHYRAIEADDPELIAKIKELTK